MLQFAHGRRVVELQDLGFGFRAFGCPARFEKARLSLAGWDGDFVGSCAPSRVSALVRRSSSS